jgi:DNA-binding transcriptional MerR regulator
MASTTAATRGYRVAELADEVGVRPDTIRYYERLGLLPPAARAANGYRRFDPGVVDRVRFIKGAQRSGLRLVEIKELLEIGDRGACPCGHTRTLLERRLRDVDEDLDRLRVLRGELADMLVNLDGCTDRRAGGWWCEREFVAKGGDRR